MSDEAPDSFIVSVPEAERVRLRLWYDWARRNGFYDAFAAAVREVHRQLTVRPREWGEFRYPLDGLEADTRFGAADMFQVGYAVHRRLRVVFVKRYQIRPDFAPGRPPEPDEA